MPISKKTNYQQTIAWLQNARTPSIRYMALTQLRGLPESNPEASAARRLIATTNPAREILQEQNPEGWWIHKRHYYSPKYRSTHWSMLLLSELALDPQHPSLQMGADYMLAKMEKEIPDYRPGKETGLCCFWGNWLRYELYSGRQEDERVQQVVEILGADLIRQSRCPYNYGLPCAWGVIRDLYGLALIPEARRSAELNSAIQKGIHFLLDEFDLTSANYPYRSKIHPVWLRVNFPLFYQSDILFTLRVLREYRALHHPSAQKALNWLINRRNLAGIWRGSSPFAKRTWPFTTTPDDANHWVTLHAIQVLS